MTRVVDDIDFSITLEREEDDRIRVDMEEMGATQLFVWEGDTLTIDMGVVITEEDDDDGGSDYRIGGDLG